jgi:hypothetical protein
MFKGLPEGTPYIEIKPRFSLKEPLIEKHNLGFPVKTD